VTAERHRDRRQLVDGDPSRFTGDDMVVGEDVAVGAHHDAGPEAALDAAAAADEQYRLAALEGMRDYIDRLSGEYKENAESSTLINYEQASNAQCRIFAAKPLWSAAVRHRTDWLWRT